MNSHQNHGSWLFKALPSDLSSATIVLTVLILTYVRNILQRLAVSCSQRTGRAPELVQVDIPSTC